MLLQNRLTILVELIIFPLTVSLFGFLSFALFPIPVYFIRYGRMLRESSRFARESDALIAGMRAQAARATETDADLAADVEAGDISVVNINAGAESDHFEKSSDINAVRLDIQNVV